MESPLPEIYRHRPPSAEALSIAAEQLWILERDRLPMRVVYALAGRSLTPVHALVPAERAAVPPGLHGIRARTARYRDRAGRVWQAIRRGHLRPSVVTADAELFLKRERLFAIVENGIGNGTEDGESAG